MVIKSTSDLAKIVSWPFDRRIKSGYLNSEIRRRGLLTIKKNQTGSTVTAIFEGVVDQTSDFEIALGFSFKELRVDVHAVTRINSLGILNWRNYFHKLRCEGVKIEFSNLQPAMVDQANFIFDFILKTEIRNLAVPYFCTHCSKMILKNFELEGLTIDSVSNSRVSCPVCSQQTELDTVLEEYFSFLEL